MGSIKTNLGTMSKGFININGTTKSISKIFYGSTQIFSSFLPPDVTNINWIFGSSFCQMTVTNPNNFACVLHYQGQGVDSSSSYAYTDQGTQSFSANQTKTFFITNDGEYLNNGITADLDVWFTHNGESSETVSFSY